MSITYLRVDHDLQYTKGIITFNWPSRSPDLNQIKQLWDNFKDEIAMYLFMSASQETVEQAKATLVKVWREFPQELIDRHCQSFHEKLNSCIIHGGNNNFDG
ncbi:hypothetical protein L873DRAFT_1798234 [Choiromyces venosus 120613-1]|uniref:Tc1-like transposase DDE domain-containing protein n=1 Tax=Choiromyces venosus 120613-1 TaxID=1336337 RepID=A0A3N4K7K7_9PEZI|nr:hypothetical protein L873DRAFT_1798234 [Choiromyces venosus 120613-1]